MADTIVPTFAISSPRRDEGMAESALLGESPAFSVAPGDWTCFELQQSGLSTSAGRGSSDIVESPTTLASMKEW